MPFNDADATRFSQLLSALAVTFGKEADTPMFIGYEMALDDLPLDAIDRAVRRAIRECKFMPSGSELRELAGAAGEVKASDRSIVAYGAACRAVQSVGGYQAVSFDDPLANAAVRNMGGWERFCDWPTDEMQWRQRDFCRHYEALSASGISGELAAPLPGICDGQNAAGGFLEFIPPTRKVCCGLPEPRKGIVRGPVPERRSIVAGLQKRIAGLMGKFLSKLNICLPSQNPERLKSPVEQMTVEQFEEHKAEMIERLRRKAEATK